MNNYFILLSNVDDTVDNLESDIQAELSDFLLENYTDQGGGNIHFTIKTLLPAEEVNSKLLSFLGHKGLSHVNISICDNNEIVNKLKSIKKQSSILSNLYR